MNNKYLRITFLVVQSLALLVGIVCCVFGLVKTPNISLNDPYLTTAIRLVVLIVATVTYYKTSSSVANQGGLFMMVCIFTVTLSELRILSDFSALIHFGFIPQNILARIILFTQFMIYVTLIGYAIYYQNNEYVLINRFLLLGIAAAFFLALMSPYSQDLHKLWSMSTPLILLTLLTAVTIITNLFLAFSEPTSAGAVKHMSIIFMIIGNYMLVAFGNPVVSIVGTSLFVIGCAVEIITVLRTSVIL